MTDARCSAHKVRYGSGAAAWTPCESAQSTGLLNTSPTLHMFSTGFAYTPLATTPPDDQLKESWLKAMSPEDRARLVMTFDDRDRVVAMWRRNGVVCAQVAPGDF
jgi:hypothetical protein